MIRRAARVASTHLFRGVRLTFIGGGGEWLTAGELDLNFADGVTVSAELLVGDPSENVVLAVPAYTTTAGTALPANVWQIADWAIGPNKTPEVRLGSRLPITGP